MHKFMSNVKNQLRSSTSKSDQPQQSQSSSSSKLFVYSEHDDHRRFADASDKQPRPLKVGNVVELGNVHSSSTTVKRDLGFHGRLGSYAFLTYGDSMHGDGEQFRGMTCNSIAIATKSPTEVLDPLLDENKNTRFFLRPNEEAGEDPSVYSLGITNIVDTRPGQGTL